MFNMQARTLSILTVYAYIAYTYLMCVLYTLTIEWGVCCKMNGTTFRQTHTPSSIDGTTSGKLFSRVIKTSPSRVVTNSL